MRVLKSVPAICLASSITFFVPVLDRVLDHLGTIRTCVVPRTTAVITIVVVDTVVIASLLQPQLVLSDPIPVPLLVAEVLDTALLFKDLLTLALDRLPV